MGASSCRTVIRLSIAARPSDFGEDRVASDYLDRLAERLTECDANLQHRLALVLREMLLDAGMALDDEELRRILLGHVDAVTE